MNKLLVATQTASKALMNLVEDAEAYEIIDDGMDAIMEKLISKKYGVEVHCNPNGDRSLISIDSEEMDMSGFEHWLDSKDHPVEEATNSTPRTSGLRFGSNLPNEVEVNSTDAKVVSKYLRKTYGYCLAKGYNVGDNISDGKVKNIQWGRKLTTEERNRITL